MLRRRGTFASLSISNYRLFFWGQVAWVAGTWVQNSALAWLVLEMTQSGTAVGLLLAMRYLPILILGPYGGLLADRLNGRRLLFGAQTLTATLSVALVLIVAADIESLAVLYVLALGLGAVNAVSTPVRQTLINEMVPRDLLSNALALNSISGNAARIFGPLLAGALIATVGLAWCFVLDAAASAVLIGTVLLMRPDRMYTRSRAVRAPGQLREGFRYIAHTPVVLLPMTMVAVVGTFAWEFQVTLPLVASETFHGGPWAYGALLSSLSIGATAGALWIAYSRSTSMRATALSAIFLGFWLGVAAMAPNLWVALGVLLVVGWGMISFNVRAKSALQLGSVPTMRGRVMAVWAVAWNGSTVVGGPIVGWVGETFGARWSLVAGAVPAVVVGGYALVHAARHKDIDVILARADIPDEASELP